MDLVFGIFIFSICLVIYYMFIPNLQSQELNNLQEVYMETKTISESLTSQGYPLDWTEETVERIGITDGNKKINSTKLQSFYNLSLTNYSRTRSMFGLRGDYVVFFTYVNESPAGPDGIYKIGDPDVGLDAQNNIDMSAIDNDNLVSLRRVLVHDARTIIMVVYSWY